MRRFYFILLISFILINQNTQAKNLHGRLGMGYNRQFPIIESKKIPAINLKYGLTPSSSIEIITGFKSKTDSSHIFALKIYKDLIKKISLNFYIAGGLGYLKLRSESGLSVMIAIGSEFFIPGLEEIGLSIETGIGGSNLKDEFVISTFGASFIESGINFYF